MPTKPFKWLALYQVPIIEQLHIEEALLRNTTDNFLITNIQPPEAIVLGASRQLDVDVHVSHATSDGIPVIKRYSGGGSVFLDQNSIMVSWIVNSLKLMPLSSEIFEWTRGIYAPLFPRTFAIRENDYTLDNKKIGGNAQYIQRYRWVHHTTFLWDFDSQKLNRYLPIPAHQPLYRQQRSHKDFLTVIHPWFPSKQDFLDELLQKAQESFLLVPIEIEDLGPSLTQHSRKGTQVLIEAPLC